MTDDPDLEHAEEIRSQLTRLVRTKSVVCGCGCIVWTGGTDTSSYGKFKLRGRVLGVHRYAYESLVGEIPDGMTVDHLCSRHRVCLNPEHFELVTRSENSVRANQRRWHETIDRSACTYTADGHPITTEGEPS